MKNIVCFSGGKDSTALLLWAKTNLSDFVPVFCDTGWEHPITYGYISYINEKVLDGQLVTISSERYPGGFRECVLDHEEMKEAYDKLDAIWFDEFGT